MKLSVSLSIYIYKTWLSRRLRLYVYIERERLMSSGIGMVKTPLSFINKIEINLGGSRISKVMRWTLKILK